MLDDILAEVDDVLLMAVEPGFGGQGFIPSSLERIAGLRVAVFNQHGSVAENLAALRRAAADSS